MKYAREVTNFVDYGLTIAEATGIRHPSPVEKYGVTSSKLLVSVSQNSDRTNVAKEVAQAGVSVLCDVGGHITGDKRTAAQIELFGKAFLDIVAIVMSDKRN